MIDSLIILAIAALVLLNLLFSSKNKPEWIVKGAALKTLSITALVLTIGMFITDVLSISPWSPDTAIPPVLSGLAGASWLINAILATVFHKRTLARYELVYNERGEG